MPNLLISIRDRLFPKKPSGLPYNLKPSELIALKNLHASADWPIYQSLLDTLVNFHAEQMLSAADTAEVHRLRGLILGLRKAGTLVTEIIRQQEYEDARRSTSERTAADRDHERQLALYGSYFGGGFV